MEIFEVVSVAIIIAIIAFASLTFIGITIWSSLILSMLIAISFMITLFPISELMKRELDSGVLFYISAVVAVFVFVIIYVVVKCCLDFRCCD